MSLDSTSPVASARVRCLLLPVGRITQKRFSTLSKRLQKEDIVRLSDVSPNNEGEAGNIFSPLAFPAGLVFYEMTPSLALPSLRALAPFEPFWEPLLVLGIADAFEYPDVENGASEHEGEKAAGFQELVYQLPAEMVGIRDAYPKALVHRILVFDVAKTGTKLSHGCVSVPSTSVSARATLRAFMCESTAMMLGELGSRASSYQTMAIETPKSQGAIQTARNRLLRQSVQMDGTSKLSRQISGVDPGTTFPPEGQVDKRANRMSMPVNLSRVSSPDSGSVGSRRSQELRLETPPPPEDGQPLPLRKPRSAAIEDENSESRDPSVQGIATVTERARTKTRGRLKICMGSLYLIAGRWTDALRDFCDGGYLAKLTSDHVWHAKALEQILTTLLICAWAKLDIEIPQLCYQTLDKSLSPKSSKATPTTVMTDLYSSKAPTAESRTNSLRALVDVIPDLAHQILHLYIRATSFQGETVPQVAFSLLVIRLARLQTAIYAANGRLEDNVLHSIVVDGPKLSVEDKDQPDDEGHYLNKLEISAFLLRAIPISTEGVPIADQLLISNSVVNVLSILGQERKRAQIIRGILSGLIPALIDSRKAAAADEGVHPSLSILAPPTGPLKGQLSNILIASNLSGVKDLLNTMCEIYGVIVRNEDETTSSEAKQVSVNNFLAEAQSKSLGSQDLKIEALRVCISICEALPDLSGVLDFSRALLAIISKSSAPGSTTGDVSPELPREDQQRLVSNILRANYLSKQIDGTPVEVHYWDEFLVRDVRLANDTKSLLTPRTKADISTLLKLKDDAKSGPFIYNAFGTRQSVTADPIIVAGDRVILEVLLQNLFDVEIEVESLRIISDPPMVAELENVVLYPYRTQRIRVPAVMDSFGQLIVTGCIVKIRGCKARTFQIYKDSWQPSEAVKLKADAQWTIRGNFNKDEIAEKPPIPSKTILQVIPSQPTLSLSIAKQDQPLLLMDGEIHETTVQLYNGSNSTVDFVIFSLKDPISDRLISLLDKKELSAQATYDLEYQLHVSPVAWTMPKSTADIVIQPKETKNVKLFIRGKSGLTHLDLIVDYAYLGVNKQDFTGKFYTRRAKTNLTISVNPSVVAIGADGCEMPESRNLVENGHAHVPMTPPPSARSTFHPADYLKDALTDMQNESAGDSGCLALIDVFCDSTQPVEAVLETKSTEDTGEDNLGNWEDRSTAVLQPKMTTRLVVPVPRIPSKSLRKPIPYLGHEVRQFVVRPQSGTGGTQTEDLEQFWLKEGFLDSIRLRWQQPRSHRRGYVNMRSMALTPGLLRHLRKPELKIEVSVKPEDGETKLTNETASSTQKIQACTFTTLRIVLTNRSEYPILPFTTIIPRGHFSNVQQSRDLNKKVAVDGLTQQTFDELAPGAQFEYETAMTFFAAGEYDVDVEVTDIRPIYSSVLAESHGVVPVKAIPPHETRSWQAQKPCHVDVYE